MITTRLSGAEFDLSIQFDVDALRERLTPEQMQAVFAGIATVLVAGSKPARAPEG